LIRRDITVDARAWIGYASFSLPRILTVTKGHLVAHPRPLGLFGARAEEISGRWVRNARGAKHDSHIEAWTKWESCAYTWRTSPRQSRMRDGPVRLEQRVGGQRSKVGRRAAPRPLPRGQHPTWLLPNYHHTLACERWNVSYTTYLASATQDPRRISSSWSQSQAHLSPSTTTGDIAQDGIWCTSPSSSTSTDGRLQPFFPGPGSPMEDGYASFNLKESAGWKLQTAPLLATWRVDMEISHL